MGGARGMRGGLRADGSRETRGRLRPSGAAAILLLAALGLSACAGSPPQAPSAPGSAPPAETPDIVLPPAGGAPDYQLGGAYEADPGVEIVVRDRLAPPAEGRYSVCYVNGFQTQPGELGDWPEDLVLRRDGEPVADPAWPDEALLDTSTDERRERIAEIVGAWIERCATDGFDAVEFDNLDSYTRSGGALDLDDNLALATAYVRTAHGAGLAAGQKNTVEASTRLRDEAGFDFAVAEGCLTTDECGEYARVYGERVIDIEYVEEIEAPFDELCSRADAPRSTVLRDLPLTVPGGPGYTFALC